ncbi:MAG: hypothetical protein AAGI50_06280 [Pseudomonadota bacterium]
MRPITVTAALCVVGAAFAEQPPIPLPILGSEAWRMLDQIGLHEEQNEEGYWQVIKTFPDPLLEAAAKPFTITGYIIPVTAEPVQRTVLLVRNTEDCPFCGSAGYAPALEVWLARPMRDVTEFDRVTLTGSLQLVEDPGTLQTAVLTAARVEE